jgi:hypothetical protein
MHLSEGEIRAYQDQELRPDRYPQVKAHLVACAECQQRADRMLSRSQQAGAALSSLDAGEAKIMPASTARQRLNLRLAQSTTKEYSMKNNPSLRRYRPVWIGLAIVVVLAVSLNFAPVRAIANDFLGLFRVQQITVVQVDPASLAAGLDNPAIEADVESLFGETVEMTMDGESQPAADAAQASSLAGFPVRLPSQLPSAPTLLVEPGGNAQMTIDLPRLQALLSALGQDDVQLSESLDGAVVSVAIPSAVSAQYGSCASPAEDPAYDPDRPWVPQCVQLMQVPSPQVSAPPELDVRQLGEAYLRVMGMNPRQAARFAQDIDWTTTLVVPIPSSGVDYQQVEVDGVQGTLILEKYGQGNGAYVLIWVRDGIVYALSGPGNAITAVQIANSLQ